MKNVFSHMESKFTSGNAIPVKQTILKADEWYALRDMILQLRKENERLKWMLDTQD